jgi:hypothetical protein
LKTAEVQRSAELLAEFEQQLASRYSYDWDEIWKTGARCLQRPSRGDLVSSHIFDKLIRIERGLMMGFERTRLERARIDARSSQPQAMCEHRPWEQIFLECELARIHWHGTSFKYCQVGAGWGRNGRGTGRQQEFG